MASGIAAIPLLTAKLWAVYARLFTWPPVRSVRHALERLSVAVLVAAGIFELFTGLLNTFQWYPWPFNATALPLDYLRNWLLAMAAVAVIAVAYVRVRAGLRWAARRR